MRMQKTAEWMKQGYGDHNMAVENKMAEGLDQLTKDLQDVQKSVEAGDGNGKPGQQKGEQALAEVRNCGACWNRRNSNAASKGKAKSVARWTTRSAAGRHSNRADSKGGNRVDKGKSINTPERGARHRNGRQSLQGRH